LSEAEAYQALASRSRLGILKLLYKKPLSIDEISRMISLQPVTVRHHLQSLEEAGFIESYEERVRAVGRPKVYYRIAKEPHLVGFPKRHYLMLSSFLINTLRVFLGSGRAENMLRKVGEDMGESTMRKLELENQIDKWSPGNYEEFFVNGYLKEAGAEPEIVEASEKRIVYRLHNCLFFELAVKMPEVMCDVLHESFHNGVSKAMSNQVRMSRLTCMGKGDPYCEHVCEWLNIPKEYKNR